MLLTIKNKMKQITKLELAIREFKTQSIRQGEGADLTDEWNSVYQHIHDIGYNPENFEDLSEYMLRATNIEAASYYEDYFFPRFVMFHEWVESDNVVRKKGGTNTLFNYYLKEYYNV